jgi:hypothetical protein
MTYNWQSNTTVYYTLPLPGYMFRLLGVILRPSIVANQDYLITSALWDPLALTIGGINAVLNYSQVPRWLLVQYWSLCGCNDGFWARCGGELVSCILSYRRVAYCLAPWGTSSDEADSGIVYGGDCPLRCVAVAVCYFSCRGWVTFGWCFLSHGPFHVGTSGDLVRLK